MARITEDFVSFETAKLLKEKGFDEYCPLWYNLDKPIEGPFFYKEIGWYGHNSYDYNGKRIVSAPTLQMAMKWLREIYSLEIYPYHDIPKVGDKWWFEIIKYPNSVSEYESETAYNSSEETCEAAIKYCLENLI